MKRILFLLSALLLSSLVALLSQAAPHQSSKLFSINWYLIHHGKRGDIEKNIETAMNLLASLRADEKIPMFENIKEDTIAFLDDLKKLRESVEGRLCNEKSYELRKKWLDIIESISNQKYQPQRLEEVIEGNSEKLAEICQIGQLEAYQQIKELEQKSRNNIVSEDLEAPDLSRTYFTIIIRKKISIDNPEICCEVDSCLIECSYSNDLKWAQNEQIMQKVFDEFIAKKFTVATFSDAEIAYNIIEKLVKEKGNLFRWPLLKELFPNDEGRDSGSNRKVTIGANRADKIFSHIIVDNCEYLANLYAGVFGRSEGNIWKPNIRGSGKLIANYYIDWAVYKGCLSIINDNESDTRLLTRLKLVAKEKAHPLWIDA